MLLVKYYFPFNFPSLLKLSFSLTPKTLQCIQLRVYCQFPHWTAPPSMTTHVMDVPQRSSLFLLYLLKVLVTNTSGHHCPRALDGNPRSALHQCRAICKGQRPWPGSSPQATKVQGLWTGVDLASAWINLRRVTNHFPELPSGAELHWPKVPTGSYLLLAFFPSQPHLLTSC